MILSILAFVCISGTMYYAGKGILDFLDALING